MKRLIHKTQREFEKRARQLRASPRFLHMAKQKMGELGVVGEERNRLVLALACLTRTLPMPASVLVKGPTSSGKSTLVEACLRLFPPSSIVERAGLSPKALAYGTGSLGKKILFLNEYRCGKDAQLFTRLLQSQGQIKHEATTTRGAQRGTQVVRRVGIPVVLSTTTDEKVFADDETRFLSIWVDQSSEQSRKIVLARSQRPRIPECEDLPLWQKAMSLVKNKQGNFENPPEWMKYVANNLPLSHVRVRRDWDRFLSFCSAVALCRAFEDQEPVNISFKDYCVAYRILEPVFASSLHDPSSQEYALGRAVARLHRKRKRAVMIREIAEELGWNESLAYKQLKVAIKKRLVTYEPGTRERNVKRVLPIDGAVGRFLPSPLRVMKHNPELGKRVKYIDPFTGQKSVIER